MCTYMSLIEHSTGMFARLRYPGFVPAWIIAFCFSSAHTVSGRCKINHSQPWLRQVPTMHQPTHREVMHNHQSQLTILQGKGLFSTLCKGNWGSERGQWLAKAVHKWVGKQRLRLRHVWFQCYFFPFCTFHWKQNKTKIHSDQKILGYTRKMEFLQYFTLWVSLLEVPL